MDQSFKCPTYEKETDLIGSDMRPWKWIQNRTFKSHFYERILFYETYLYKVVKFRVYVHLSYTFVMWFNKFRYL